VLATTRAVRRRLDLTRPVPPAVIEECVMLARQAPIAGNVERCRFLAVSRPELRAAIADVYRSAAEEYVYRSAPPPDATADPRALAMARVLASAAELRDHLQEVPVLMLVGSEARPPAEGVGAVASGFYGSVYPAIWSFQLALRSRGLGSSLTCIHLHHADRLTEVLRLPTRWVQVALVPVAYTRGLRFHRADRELALSRVLRWETWEGTEQD
jgi:nitroreductase